MSLNFSSSSTKVEPTWCHDLPTFSVYFCDYSVKKHEIVYLLLPSSCPSQQEKCQILSLLCYEKWCCSQFGGWRWYYVCCLLNTQVTDRMVSQINGQPRTGLCLSVADVAAYFICWLFWICTETGIRSYTSDWDSCTASTSKELVWKPIIHHKLNF